MHSFFFSVPASSYRRMFMIMLMALMLIMDGYGFATAQTFQGGGNVMRQGGNNFNAGGRIGRQPSAMMTGRNAGRSPFGGNSRNTFGGNNRNFGGGMGLGAGNAGGRPMDPARMYPKVPNAGAASGRSNRFNGPAFSPPRQQGVAIY
jgi:hypothetical protein